jgi:pyruvate/2-oxoglutarate dehydrogenase complex dihydrolipoamide dehydrogenase (E3) component
MTHVVVVGAYGSAGVAVAETLADAPEVDQLTMVDDGDPGGGLCILRGCMPSKEVLSAADHRHRARADSRLDGTPDVDLNAVVETKDEHIHSFAEHRRAAVHDLADRDGVTFHGERAEFRGPHTVVVGGRAVDADYVVLATGSSVNVPNLDGIDDVPYMTSADVLDATEFPDTGVVMGFGYVGAELAPYLAEAAGMDLTVIEHDQRPLDRADDAFGDALLSLYREEFGIDVRTEVYETRVEQTDRGVRLHLDDGSAVEADQLFLFTGRELSVPDALTGHLDPGDGWVRDTMRARADDRTFVAGDARGDPMLLHVAKEEGYTAGENVRRAVRGDSLEEYHPTHHEVMFSGVASYPYASVGQTAAEAERAGRDVVTATRHAADDGVFKTKDAPHGLAKLVVAADGEVLGYHGLHLHADVMAKTIQVVVENGLDVREVPDRAYHPTTPEIIDGLLRETRAAVETDLDSI